MSPLIRMPALLRQQRVPRSPDRPALSGSAQSPGPQMVKPVAISVQAERCLRTHNRFTQCCACTDACPAGAIQASATVLLDAEVCTGCGACLAICPAGVFEGDDGVANLLEAAVHVRGQQMVEITCPRGTATPGAPAPVDAVLRSDACLASLGIATYLGLLGLGIGQIVARTDICTGCAKSAALANIEGNLAAAAEILVSLQQPQRIVSWSHIAGSEWCVRPVATTSGARVSRRDFFRVAAGRPGELQGTPAPAAGPGQPRLHAIPRERRRMLDALRRLIEIQSAAAGRPLPAGVFWQLAASEACSACRLCANLCPTGAIQLALGSDDTYALSFLSAACTGCGECVDMCESRALHQDGAPSARALLALEPTTLRSGRLYRCERCATRFAAPAEARLCPLCTRRATRPFGAALPPGIQPRLSRPVRR